MVVLQDVQWRKSSYSGSGNACVEVARTPAHVAVRDSKNPAGPALAFDRDLFRRFASQVKAGSREV